MPPALDRGGHRRTAGQGTRLDPRPPSFTESFSKVFGRSVGDLLRETRLRKGAHLLRTTDLPVQSVAHRVGFSSRSHFSRAFTAEFGKGPAEFRVRG